MQTIIDAFTEYKQFISSIKRFPFAEVMKIAREINLYQTFNVRMTNIVPISHRFRFQKGTMLETWQNMYVFPWELEILVREYLKIFRATTTMNKSLSKGYRFVDTFNHIKSISDSAHKEFGEIELEDEIWKISVQQFHWQRAKYIEELIRFYVIFSDDELVQLLRSVSSSFNPRKMILLGASLLGFYLRNIELKRTGLNVQLTNISNEDFHFFISAISTTIEQLHEEYPSKLALQKGWEHEFNPLSKYPLILHNNSYFAPLPSLIIRRVTIGMRYFLFDLVSDSAVRGNIQNAFGKSFEKYCFNLADKLKQPQWNVLPESIFYVNDKEKRTQDVIIETPEDIVFMECKVRKLSKTLVPENTNSYEVAIDTIVGILKEAYTALTYYVQDKYPTIRHDNKRNKRLLIVLLDEVYVIPYLYKDQFNEQIKSKLITQGVDSKVMADITWEVCGIDIFEDLLAHWGKYGIAETYAKHVSVETLPAIKTDECIQANLQSIFDIKENILSHIYNEVGTGPTEV